VFLLSINIVNSLDCIHDEYDHIQKTKRTYVASFITYKVNTEPLGVHKWKTKPNMLCSTSFNLNSNNESIFTLSPGFRSGVNDQNIDEWTLDELMGLLQNHDYIGVEDPKMSYAPGYDGLYDIKIVCKFEHLRFDSDFYNFMCYCDTNYCNKFINFNDIIKHISKIK